MKKKFLLGIVIVAAIIIVAVLALAGFINSDKAAEKIIEKTITGLIEKENQRIEAENPTVVIGWPAWMPSFVPEYKYGLLYSEVPVDEEHNSGTVYYEDLKSSEDPFNSYIADLEAAGWDTDKEKQAGDSRQNAKHMVHSKGYSLSYVVDKGGTMALSVMKDGLEDKTVSSGRGDSGPTTEVLIDDKQSGLKVTQTNEKIPVGYREDLCPLYKPSELTGAQEFVQESFTTYTMSLKTGDSWQKVVNYYKKSYPKNVSVVMEGELAIVSVYADNSHECTVTIIVEDSFTGLTVNLRLD